MEFIRGFCISIGSTVAIMVAFVLIGMFARFAWLCIKLGWRCLD